MIFILSSPSDGSFSSSASGEGTHKPRTRATPIRTTDFYPLVAALPLFVRWLSLNPSCQVDSAPPPILEMAASTK